MVIANPFHTDRPREKLTRDENNKRYSLNPSIQLLNIAYLSGADTNEVALLSAVGAVGDRAHQYSNNVRHFVEGEAKSKGLGVADLERVAAVFELAERFPKEITSDEIIQKYLGAVRSGRPLAILEDPKIRRLNEDWNNTFKKYAERIERGEYDVQEVTAGGKRVKVIVMHVDPEDEKRIQKIKSAIGSALLDKFAGVPEPVVVAAGQWEPGDVLNYRIGVNAAGQDVGLHAGRIANLLASKFGMAGGGHAAVAGAKIPYTERERALEHIVRAVEEHLTNVS